MKIINKPEQNFNNIQFNDHPLAKYGFDKMGKMIIDDNFELSVINGENAYSTSDTFEVAVIDRETDEITYKFHYDVYGYQTPDEINKLADFIHRQNRPYFVPLFMVIILLFIMCLMVVLI